MSNGKKARKLPWLTARSQPALISEHRETLVQIAKSASSPSAARDQAYLETGDIQLAQACRWLAVVKRDHGKPALAMVLSSVTIPNSRLTGTRRSQTMSTKAKSAKPAQKPEATEAAVSKPPTLPLRQIKFRAVVNGVMAQVRCLQEFENDAAKPVEAVYTFPLPDEATVVGCRMKIGRRKVEAVLKAKEKARQEYAEAVAAGHYGALLEQQRPNIFTMNVGGIEPGEKISVEVDYLQRVPWQAGGGRFRIPLVVAPRFIPGVPTGKQACLPARQGGGWAPDTDAVPDASLITPAVSRPDVTSGYQAEISVSLTPGFGCRVDSPTHTFAVGTNRIRKNDTTEYKTGPIRPDRDFILTYQATSSVPEVAAFTGTFGDEGFLLAQIMPPGTVQPTASDIVLLLDISGSMNGSKLDGLKVVAKKVLKQLVDQKVGHHVGIIAFENKPHLLQPMAEVSMAMEGVIDQLTTIGGTELGPALDSAYRQFKDSGRPPTILLVTDGQTESFQFQGSGARIVAIGIDTAVNDTLLKDLARKTNGACEWFYPGEDFDRAANRITGMLSGPVLRNVTVESVGQAVGISDVFAGLPATIAIRFPTKMVTETEIKGIAPDGKEVAWKFQAGIKGIARCSQDIAWEMNLPQIQACDFAHQLWAREFIRENPDAKKQTEASLKYGVICQGTSFVAISEKEVPGQKPERVEIPVNLPHGWNFDAVFGSPTMGAIFLGSGQRRGRAMKGLADFASLGSPDVFRGLFAESEFGDDEDGMVGVADDLLRGGGPPRLPVVPPSQPPQPTPTTTPRFSLEAADEVDRLVGILIALHEGRRQEAEVAFQKLEAALTPAKIRSLSEEKLAMAFYFLTRLKGFGLPFTKNLFRLLLIPSVPSQSIDAKSWHCLGMREIGHHVPSVQPALGDGWNYILWKYGSGQKPDTEPWSLVP